MLCNPTDLPVLPPRRMDLFSLVRTGILHQPRESTECRLPVRLPRPRDPSRYP